MKVCLEPGCPTLTDRSRCPEHERAKDKARGTRQQRGYGAEHDALRRLAASAVATGNQQCWRCGKRLAPDEPFDLGHDDTDRRRYRGPECLPCNRATACRRISPDA